MRRLIVPLLVFGCVALGATTFGAQAVTTSSTVPWVWKNCTHVHAKYRHGVGKLSAHDRTTSGAPVTTFRRSTRLYNVAMSYNRGLDGDKDGIACEQH